MKDDFLKEFLNIFWLRPETAIFNALLAKNLPNNFVQGASIDLGCGDGLFAFTANGGKLDKKFNLYQNTSIKSSIISMSLNLLLRYFFKAANVVSFCSFKYGAIPPF